MGQQVYVVDDDDEARGAIARLLQPLGYDLMLYSNPTTFLETDISGGGCLILDVRLPGTSGLKIQERLIAKGADLSIVFISGHPDIATAVEAMKAGAVDFLQKPFRAQQLLDAVNEALTVNAERKSIQHDVDVAAQTYGALSPTERTVMSYVTSGLLNKQIAAETGRSENTIKVHRARIMRKMKVGSLADLVRVADRLGVIHQRTAPTK